MKHLLCIIILSMIILNSCEKPEPEIASPDELSVKTLSDNFICQPVGFQSSIAGIVKSGKTTRLNSYDANGNILWQQDIDSYMLPSYTFDDIDYFNLEKDIQNNLLVVMQATETRLNQQIVNQHIRAVKFNASGQYLWQLTDTIHQPDTIVISTDTVAMAGKGLFYAIDFTSYASGNYAIVSSLVDSPVDSTILQISEYSSSGYFVQNHYIRILGQREFSRVKLTSDNSLFLISRIEGSGASFMKVDLSGNILFETAANGLLLDSYFIHETQNGGYILSLSYADQSLILKGVLILINSSGNVMWVKVSDFNPSWIFLSVQVLADGFVFSGFDTGSLLLTGIDWRKSFEEEEHHAVIVKTNFLGEELWQKTIETDFYTVGAVSCGEGPITVFGGKYEVSGESIFLIKLNNSGEIYAQ